VSHRYILLLCSFLLFSCVDHPPQKVVFHTEKGSYTFSLRVARSPAERARGLMHTTLKSREGMLFIFERQALIPFWMKNTPESLDFIFLDNQGGIVDWRAEAPAFSLDYIESAIPFRFAIEVPAGTLRSLKLKKGTHPEFHPPLPQ